jgi:hypothetical protein
MTELSGVESEYWPSQKLYQNSWSKMVARDHRLRDKWQTRPLVREGAPHRQNRNCLIVTNIWSWPPKGLDTETDWPTDRRS